MKSFFLIFLLVPLVEIYFLIEVGGVIGAVPTIALVVFTALLGAWLVRAQGFATFARFQMQLAKGQSPALEMLEGLALFAAGALLLTPGFFTDAVGFMLLLPSLRRKLLRHLINRSLFGIAPGAGPGHSTKHGRVIDVDYDKID